MDTQQFLKDIKQTAQEKAEELADSRTYVDKDGVVYEWDEDRNGWFPKVDEDFLATYQMNYGFVDGAEATSSEPLSSQPTIKTSGATTQDHPTTSTRVNESAGSGGDPDSKEGAGKKRKKEEPGWFNMDDSKNTNVYISGLPLDITNEEFLDLMSKYGIVMEDPDTKQPKLKLYRDDQGNVKGDGRCCYLKIESVDLALQLLDETDYRGSKVHVEKAEFHMKGAYNPALKKKKKKNQKKKQPKKKQEKLLDWVDRESTSRSKFDKIVIFKNMFEPKEIEEDPVLITEITDDVRAECQKHGEVKKIIVFDRHTDGIVSVAFKEQETADQCIQAMNGRWFGGKKIIAESWDGVTNYRIEESDKEREQRLKKWEEYLQTGEKKE